MINYAQFKRHVVDPVCKEFPTPRKAAELLMKIAAHESSGGTYLHQIRGPAIGPWQMEPGTFRLVQFWAQANETHHGGYVRVSDASEMHVKLDLACYAARFLLRADPHPLPSQGKDIDQYNYYRKVWRPGKPPTIGAFIKAHDRWLAG